MADAPLGNEAARERFRRFVELVADGCWLWRGCTSQKDWHRYGHFRLRGRVEGAHRAAFLLWVGSIPPEHEVHHVCENTLCVNPSHLQAVPKVTNGYLALRGRERTT